MTIPHFEAFPKIPRLSREVVITEKLDGTNALVHIYGDATPHSIIAGSRSRYIIPQDDNYGFARWVQENRDELMKLGEGKHYGEWWGSDIQRGYGLVKGEKRFSLFNTHRWSDDAIRPKCCHVVPVLGRGILSEGLVDDALVDLRENGSLAAPGFMNPEGMIIYHTAANIYFKKTLDKDEEPKGK